MTPKPYSSSPHSSVQIDLQSPLPRPVARRRLYGILNSGNTVQFTGPAMDGQSTTTAPCEFRPFPRLPAELRLQIWETYLAASDSEPVLTTSHGPSGSRSILCISPLTAVNHESRCAALSWAHTRRQHHRHQHDRIEDPFELRIREEKLKEDEARLERYPGSYFRPFNPKLDVHFFREALPRLLQEKAEFRVIIGGKLLLRQRNERIARHSAPLHPHLPRPEPEILLGAPFYSLASDWRIKYVAISALQLGPLPLGDAGLAELWKQYRMEVLFVILPPHGEDSPGYYRDLGTLERCRIPRAFFPPLPPHRLGCGVQLWFGQDQDQDSWPQFQPQPELQPQPQYHTRSVSKTEQSKRTKKHPPPPPPNVVASSIWNPETRQFSWTGQDRPGVDRNARIAAQMLSLQSPILAETLVLAEVARFEVRYVY
ncbi:hypothetical protein BJY00DRAFT_293989 [Aspergillus carlsbadensis]|nr:hypothetical protein BJY00DRAFT_293989 [Aspergillus carlsbadensis]